MDQTKEKIILITGARGMLGSTLNKELQTLYRTICIDKEDCDITDKRAVSKFLKNLEASCVIHCAAYTEVDKAEDQPSLAYAINKDGSAHIVEGLKNKECLFVYISTDYVFDGKKTCPYVEEDEPHPLSIYGKSKLEGEKITKTAKEHLIIRTSWLYGPCGRNFAAQMLSLAKTKKTFSVVNDQIGSPTYTLDLSSAIKKMLQIYFSHGVSSGIYHITNSGSTSWYEFARYIFEARGVAAKLTPITSGELARRAIRPKNSLLSNKKFKAVTGFSLRSWQEAVKDYLETN